MSMYEPPPPFAADWSIVVCRYCRGPYDRWHRSRQGKPLYISCRVDRWLTRMHIISGYPA